MDANAFLSALKKDPASEIVKAVREVAEQILEDEPVIFSNQTPSGVLVEYSPAPRRFYRVNGVEVPSVTTVLDCLEKGGLPWWGMKIGIEGVVRLFEKGRLQTFIDWKTDQERVGLVSQNVVSDQEKWFASTDQIVDLLKEEKLTVNHVRDQAGERGTNVHDALEQWAKSGGEFFPTPQEFPESERGYVEGLLAWIDDLQPKPVLWEVMVGSVSHGFAGRLDLIIETAEPRDVVVKTYPKKADKIEELPPGRYMTDCKTSKSTYSTHHLQLAGYEMALHECGYGSTDAQYILRVTDTGKYEFVKSRATGLQFLSVVNTHQAVAAI